MRKLSIQLKAKWGGGLIVLITNTALSVTLSTDIGSVSLFTQIDCGPMSCMAR